MAQPSVDGNLKKMEWQRVKFGSVFRLFATENSLFLCRADFYIGDIAFELGPGTFTLITRFLFLFNILILISIFLCLVSVDCTRRHCVSVWSLTLTL